MGCGASSGGGTTSNTEPPPCELFPHEHTTVTHNAVTAGTQFQHSATCKSIVSLTPVQKEQAEEVRDLLRAAKSFHASHVVANEDLMRAIVVEHAAGSVLTGEQAWFSGRFLVLSGKASVVVASRNGQCNEIELATLQKGNLFGWDPFEHSFRAHSKATSPKARPQDSDWATVNASISVDTKTPFRVCLLEDGLHYHGFGASELDGVNRQFAELWMWATAPSVGIGYQPDSFLRAHFLSDLWGPIIDRFEEHEDEIRRRKRRGYRKNDLFPLQGHQIAELKDQMLHITEVWYGAERGNLSALYRWFMKSMEHVGITAYSMDDIPSEPSPDGWAVVVDGSARAKALKSRGNQDAVHVATGGMKQKQGQSAIDNTILVNVFSATEARVLLIGRRLRKVMCRFIAIRQKIILRKISDQIQVQLEAQASEESTGRYHRVVRSILRALSAEDLAAVGIDPEGFCFSLLKSRGCCLSGFGQLGPEDQVAVWDLCTRLLLPEGTLPQDTAPTDSSEDVFDKIVLWSRKYPGEFFEKNKMRHFEVMIAGVWSGRVVLVKHTAMVRMTLARYFALSWKRSQPLWAWYGSAPAQLRAPGQKEASRVRANECPYARFHGMSLPAGGFALDERRQGAKTETGRNLMMELQWVQDPSANLENWFLTDIEKIVQEALQLNPRGPKSMILPGEMFCNVGQNPKIGSSIKQTQHTQVCEGSIATYPVLQVSKSWVPVGKLGEASVHFIDIGPQGADAEKCCSCVKIETKSPTDPAVLEFLVELRLRLLARFGGAEVLDFFVTAMSNEHGGFIVIFAPIPHLEKIGTEHPDLASWANPLTKETSEAAGIQEARIDFGKGVGQFLCMKPELREQLLSNGEDTLRRIWAFNRVPDVREFVVAFARERKILE